MPISSQMYLTPGVAMAYSKFEWDDSPNEYMLDLRFNTHISLGLGLLHELGDSYSLRLNGVFYKGRYDAYNAIGFNPVQNIHHGTLDSDISLSRKLGKSVVVGVGFKHLWFYNVTIERMGADDQYKSINGLGYHLHFAYELNQFGILTAYNRLYNYKDVDRPGLSYNKSTSLDLRIYYKISIASVERRR